MSTKRPSELDIQDRVADAIWFVPQSDDMRAHYVLEYSGRGPKAYLNLWLGSNYGEELTEWNWVLHESAVELWRRDSTDEEIIEVLLPDQEQRREIRELREELEMWHQHYARQLIEAHTENKRLRAVAEAARDILEVLHWNPQMHPKIVALGVALSALDAAVAAEEPS